MRVLWTPIFFILILLFVVFGGLIVLFVGNQPTSQRITTLPATSQLLVPPSPITAQVVSATPGVTQNVQANQQGNLQMTKYVLPTLVAAVSMLSYSTPTPVYADQSNMCGAGTAPVTIDGAPHCEVTDPSVLATVSCPPDHILVTLPGKSEKMCAQGVITGTRHGPTQGAPVNQAGTISASSHGGTPHCPAGYDLVDLNGTPACKGDTVTVCDQELSRKDLPQNAINAVWDANACVFRYQILN